jgi:hydroxypyruvate isomerase
MPRFAANLHYLFTEHAFLDRFEAAARAGFRAVEFQVPYDFPPEVLSERLRTHALTMVLFDAPMGNWDAGDRGLAAVPGREQEFRASLNRVLDYGDALDCRTVHVMAGAVSGDLQRAESVYLENLMFAADFFKPHGIIAVIEPINRKLGLASGGAAYTTEGMHGYFLNHTAHAKRIVDQVARDNLRLHLDLYHMQMLEGHLAETIEAHIGLVRHFQIAGVPGRHEPTVGEINYPFLFDLIDRLGYSGWIGCEYRPLRGTQEGLRWFDPYRG